MERFLNAQKGQVTGKEVNSFLYDRSHGQDEHMGLMQNQYPDHVKHLQITK